jgi:hypothetical protein
MRLWPRKAALSIPECCPVTNELVHAMTRMYRAFIASLSVATLVVATNETFARSGGGHRGVFPSMHSPVAQSFQHHRRSNVGGLWPTAAGDFYEPSNGEPLVDATQPTSRDTHYTYTNDVPWDWAHRYPPAVTLSERPYVSSCPTETVTVAGRGGKEQIINVIRCY